MRLNDYIKRAGQSSIPLHEITGEELQRLHKEMTDIADDVISLADELGLSITLGGGSVLGAARHRGFVPWDDDIDLNITRKEWEVFAPVFQERFEEIYFIYAPDSFSDAVINAIRIYKRGTKLREIAHAPNEPNGIFVDIFLLENAPDNGAIRLCHGVLCQGLRYIASCVRLYEQRAYIESVFGKNAEAMAGYRKRFFVGRIFSFSSAHSWSLLSYKANGLCKNEASRFLTIPSGGKYYFGELIRRDSYFPPEYLPFGDHSWPVPRDYDRYLTKLYGDWKEVPPEDKREVHCLIELDFGDDDDE